LKRGSIYKGEKKHKKSMSRREWAASAKKREGQSTARFSERDCGTSTTAGETCNSKRGEKHSLK